MILDKIDQHLDAILKASGSALRHYTMQKSKDDMRAALQAAISEQTAQLRAALVGLVGADRGPALDAMEASIRAAEAPNADKVAVLNALHALRETV